MGRNHARLLQRLEQVDFIGAVDPVGDPHGALYRSRLFGSIDELLTEGVDAVTVSVPTIQHEEIALQLAEAGIHTLIEKPIASTLESANRIREAFESRSLVGAVGHIERFNPALQAAKDRLGRDALGRLFSISTLRVGPFPGRIQDVGVVKDLASHDIDLVRWLGGAKFEEIIGFTAHKMGRKDEDLVAASGTLSNGTVVNLQVNWLTPTKQRSVTVLGERGAFVIDMLASDLTYFSNASVPSEWDSMARLRGVSEGDMIRYAFRKPEPLAVELENFRDAVLGLPGAQYVTMGDGVEVIRVAELILGRGVA
jgi:predicted dehydrogenase